MFLPSLQIYDTVVNCVFQIEKEKVGPQHLKISPAVFPSSSPTPVDLLHMKQHCVTECCLKLLPNSRAVTHQPSSDFTRCVKCSCLYHAFENWRIKGKEMSFYCGWRNVLCVILFQSVLKIVSWVSILSSCLLSLQPILTYYCSRSP